MGISPNYVSDLIHDPTGEKVRARKNSYGGICKTCGAKTDGSNGRSKAPEYCKEHANTALFTYWSKSKIIAAIQEWHYLHGAPPVVTDWNKQVEGSPGQYVTSPRLEWVGKRRWPTLRAVQARFGSWANAIEAAGFPRPRTGKYRDESTRGTKLKRYTAPVIIKWIQEHAKNGLPPSSRGAPVKAAIREFGSWTNAVRAAGFEPRRQLARSTR